MPLSSLRVEEVNSHRGGERVIFYMDSVMYFLLTRKKAGWGCGGCSVLTISSGACIFSRKEATYYSMDLISTF